MSIEDSLLKHEGLRLKVYDDATGEPIVPGYTLKGHPTIGVGRCLDRNGISAHEARVLLRADIERAWDGARTFPWFGKLNSIRQEVIVEMIFSLGLLGFCQFRRLISALAAGEWNEAASEMLASTWAAQVKGRAVALADRMRKDLPT